MRVPCLLRVDVQNAGALRGRERRIPQLHHVVRWRRGLLQESDVGVHLQQLSPRLAALADILTHHYYGQFILRRSCEKPNRLRKKGFCRLGVLVGSGR